MIAKSASKDRSYTSGKSSKNWSLLVNKSIEGRFFTGQAKCYPANEIDIQKKLSTHCCSQAGNYSGQSTYMKIYSLNFNY